MKTKKNEELQSRREFFKKTAKGVLPILGAIALANVPYVMGAKENPSMDCRGGCYYTCSGSCSGGCDGGCRWGCETTCKGGCEGTSLTKHWGN